MGPDLAVDENEKDSARILRRRILQHLEGEDVTSLEDEGMSVLLDLNDKIDAAKKENGKSNESVPQQVVQEPHRVDEVVIAADAVEQGESVSAVNAIEARPVATQRASLVHPLYRRDLKIIGQIGEPNQKDKLTYSSLERQIQRALKKGYDEGEVVEAVIQAIVPGTKLKSYLESRVDLTLQALRQILRTHYIEKDATELYHSLTCCTGAQRNSYPVFAASYGSEATNCPRFRKSQVWFEIRSRAHSKSIPSDSTHWSP